MAHPESPSTIGWAPASLRSRMASRRWAKTTSCPLELHSPEPSGPRWRSAVLILSTAPVSLSRRAPSKTPATAPAMPHIDLLPGPYGRERSGRLSPPPSSSPWRFLEVHADTFPATAIATPRIRPQGKDWKPMSPKQWTP